VEFGGPGTRVRTGPHYSTWTVIRKEFFSKVHCIINAGSQYVTVTCAVIRIIYEILPKFKWIKSPNLGVYELHLKLLEEIIT
jgi:hypothetical protein